MKNKRYSSNIVRKGLDGNSVLGGCLPPRPNKFTISALSLLSMGKSNLSEHVNAIRSVSSPAVFTGMMNVALQKIRSMNVQTIAYLDDWLIWAPTKDECSQSLITVINTLQNLRFLINFEKSEKNPKHSIICLNRQSDFH